MVHSSRPPHIAPNEIVAGRYQVRNELGRGGMSVVYRARDCVMQHDVALKLLRSSEEEQPHLLFLQQEFRAMARLRHPRIVQVYDYGLLDTGAAYFTMELLPGTDLSNLRDLPIRSILRILLSIADALGFMHARGYAHRDVKPSNVRVLTEESEQTLEVKLMDCGLTERFEREGTTVAGTFAYLAPEAWLGSPRGARGDLYALGVLAYEITAGGLPFDTSTGVRLLKSKTERPRDLREVRPEVPAEFARLVCDLLMPEPASRPTSAMEVASRLAELADIEFQPDPTVYLQTPALVGRSRELTRLREDIERACAGTPNPTFIVGPAGAGKTRLLDEILLEMGLRGTVIARATGRGFTGGPYELLRELLTPLMHLPNSNTVLSRIGGPRALDPPGDPATARQSLHQSFAAFLDGVSKHRRVILAVDDIHLADAASVDALAGLAGAGTYGNIAIVATERTGEPVSQSLACWHANARRLELGRMTQDQIGELIGAALGSASPSSTLVADLERATAGNVYFVLEILRSLAARGLIERKRTRIALPESLDAVELPVDLSQALERRLASLSPAALALARVAAVVGHDMDLEFGRRLLDATDDEYFDALDELRREELIRLENRDIAISHPRLREVLNQGLALAERKELHRRVATQLLTLSTRDSGARAAELGLHFAEAGDERRALDYLVQAGDARYYGFAYFDARDAYQRALKLLHSAPLRRRRELEPKLNDHLGRICFYHDHQHGPEYLERARRYHLNHGFLWVIAPLSRVLGAALAVVIAVTITALTNAMRLRRHPLRLALTHLLDAFASTTYLANCYTYSGRTQLALEAAEHLAPFVYSKHRLPQVGYLMARAYALFLANRFDEAATASDDALLILEQDHKTPVSRHDRIHATGGALITRLWIDLARGRTKRSSWWQPFEEYVLSHPTALLESWLMEARVYAAYRRGDLAETEMRWKRFSEKAAQAEVKFVQLKTKVWVGMAYLDVGRTGDAQDIADEVVRSASNPENPFILALGLQLRGMALHAWEQLDDAQQCLARAAELIRRKDVACWELYHSILLSWSLVLLDQGDNERAAEFADRVVRHNAALTLSHDLHACRASRILGRVALAKGAIADAVEQLEHAVALASATDDLLERAHSSHSLAQALAAHGDERYASQCRQECQALLSNLANDYQLRRLGLLATEHSTEVEALSRAVQLDTRASLNSTVPDELPDCVRGSNPGAQPRSTSLEHSAIELDGHTLIATSRERKSSTESE
jgi:tetratricopeptide (TPR) repeat protein